jgi:tryptophan synthase alpha subunit
VGKFADAAVVGSAIVQAIEQAGRERAPQAVAELIASLLGARQRKTRERLAISN